MNDPNEIKIEQFARGVMTLGGLILSSVGISHYVGWPAVLILLGVFLIWKG